MHDRLNICYYDWISILLYLFAPWIFIFTFFTDFLHNEYHLKIVDHFRAFVSICFDSYIISSKKLQFIILSIGL